MKVISIGDLVTDFYYKNGKLIGVNGGMSSHNIIFNIAKLDLNTAVYGVCGDDILGKVAINSLKDVGVNIDGIEVKKDIHTRSFHVLYQEVNGKLEFISKKRCPFCNTKRWYLESAIEVNNILKQINDDDVLVFDNLNDKNQIIIDSCNSKKMLDLGQYFELESLNNQEILEKIKGKFDIINLNERVEKYLKNRFSLKLVEDVYNLLQPKMLIVTRGNKGSLFVFNHHKVNKELINPEIEVDPTGAGDAFFAVFISEYIKNNYIIDFKFIDSTFNKATKLTKKVVKKMGARGHIQNLYKIKKSGDNCTCNNFDLVVRMQIKRCNININNLETRLINAVNSGAYDKLIKVNFGYLNNCAFIGTGGSFAAAKFASKVINQLYGVNTISLYPRELYYRNNKLMEMIFLFTYSGTTDDLCVATSLINQKKKYIITKGELQKVVRKIGISKEHIISYRTGVNKGKERGFLSFEGALAPASLFLKLYFDEKVNSDIVLFIKDSINYWKNYFTNYFKENEKMLKEFLAIGSSFNIFMGDFTESAGIDLESKIIESGIYNSLVHEKKNFSHGRFINYEHLSSKKNIYFKQKTTSLYEKQLLKYLENSQNFIIESRYDGILCEYDLLLASQYLIYYIANFLNIDISKPQYSEDAMKIYFYKGEL